MGKAGLPYYGEDLANAIETAKKLIEKVESNVFTADTLVELAEVNTEIIKYAIKK